MENFKKLMLEVAMKCYDKIYMHVTLSEGVVIGNRGFVGREEIDGIVLSVGSTATRDLEMFDKGIAMLLSFEGKWEDVFVPYSAIDAILDDLEAPTFVFNFPAVTMSKIMTDMIREKDKDKHKPNVKNSKAKNAEEEKILKLDFNDK